VLIAHRVKKQKLKLYIYGVELIFCSLMVWVASTFCIFILFLQYWREKTIKSLQIRKKVFRFKVAFPESKKVFALM
jgi:hypothetical protein